MVEVLYIGGGLFAGLLVGRQYAVASCVAYGLGFYSCYLLGVGCP